MALEKLRERAYDLVVSDLRLPALDGPGLYRELQRCHPDLCQRIIFLGAIGRVPNLASRLCDEARRGQILVSQPVYRAVQELVEVQFVGHLTLKGFRTPVPAYNVLGLQVSAAGRQPADGAERMENLESG